MEDDHGKPLVLVLEGEPLVAWKLEVALTNAGFVVALALSCYDAERWLTDRSPDAAILDAKLTDGDGATVARTLVEQGVPFIVQTRDDLDGREEAFRYGSVVIKSADSFAIVELVRSLLERKTAAGETRER